ncbi:DUF5794 domain-containing protein [Halorhabdus salina]|uniref:DUF5794 domain-containing protein n=1 Tax=Halorhabdus salina TaxID=2750670 RepID=UPI0015EF8150|nr:DUF5794 domain-containing protein [Halorhabdus salina]
MSSSRHPTALAIERRVGGAGRLLATVMCLPLVDGVFPALVLAGAVSNAAGIVEVGLLVFGGSATVAVILADFDGSPREQVLTVLVVGAILLPIAAIEAALAPTISSLLDLAIFERFAGLVILAIAAKTASARIGDVLPRPGLVVGLGLVASLDLSGAQLAITTDLGLIVRGTAAAGVGVGFALLVAIFGPWLRTTVDIDRFRFGSAVALGVLVLSIYGLIPSDAPLPLAVLVIAVLLSLDPGSDPEPRRSEPATDGGQSTVHDGDTEDSKAAVTDSSPGIPQVTDDDTSSPRQRPWL